MVSQKIIKLIAGFLLVTEIFFWPAVIYAQVASIGALNPIPVNPGGSIAGNAAFNTALIPVKAAKTLCETTLKTFEATDDTARQALKFASIIGGGDAYALSLGAEQTAFSVFVTCEQGVLASLNTVVAPDIYTASVKEQMVAQVNQSIQTYKTKLEQVKGKLDVASQNIWKALLITILINTTKAVTNQLVNKLVNSYKVANIKKYTDSVATLMYDNQFIRDNFPDNQSQMMARAIMQSPILKQTIQPGIFVAANNALNYNGNSYSTNNLQYSDPDFYAKMALAGTAQANPYYLQMNYVANVEAARANSQAAAQRQIAQGNGYKAPVSCAGSLAQQAQIDQQTKSASDLLANRQKLLNDLQTAKNLGQNVSATDLAKAQADYNNALAAWNKLPYTVAGANSTNGTSSLASNLTSGTNTEGTAAIIMCEAVSSPAVLVNQGLDAIFKSINLGQYNSNNLPGSLSAISGLATQIGSSLILGGITGSNSYKINETQLVNQSVTLAAGVTAQVLNDNQQANLANGVNLTVDRNSSADTSAGKGWSINWSVASTQLSSANYVKVAGPGITSTAKLPLSGSFAVVAPLSGTFAVTVYNAGGTALTTATQSFDNSVQASNFNANSPQVAGAYTQQPSYTIRGSLLPDRLR